MIARIKRFGTWTIAIYLTVQLIAGVVEFRTHAFTRLMVWDSTQIGTAVKMVNK